MSMVKWVDPRSRSSPKNVWPLPLHEKLVTWIHWVLVACTYTLHVAERKKPKRMRQTRLKECLWLSFCVGHGNLNSSRAVNGGRKSNFSKYQHLVTPVDKGQQLINLHEHYFFFTSVPVDPGKRMCCSPSPMMVGVAKETVKHFSALVKSGRSAKDIHKEKRAPSGCPDTTPTNTWQCFGFEVSAKKPTIVETTTTLKSPASLCQQQRSTFFNFSAKIFSLFHLGQVFVHWQLARPKSYTHTLLLMTTSGQGHVLLASLKLLRQSDDAPLVFETQTRATGMVRRRGSWLDQSLGSKPKSAHKDGFVQQRREKQCRYKRLMRLPPQLFASIALVHFQRSRGCCCCSSSCC